MRTANPGDVPVLVQVRDRAGFWCNHHEAVTVKDAIRMARLMSSDGLKARVVKGPKREFVRVFAANAKDGE